MMRKFAAILLALALTFLVGCGAQTPNDPPNENDSGQAQEGLALTNMAFEPADAGGIEVHSFRLGTVDLTAANNAIIRGPVDGMIAVPGGCCGEADCSPQAHPLVVLVHGASPMAHANIHYPVHKGFDFLVQQLAAEGYVALSINVNINYAFELGESLIQDGFALDTFDAHIAYLQRANAGENVGHGVDLTNMIDFTQIHLIGHSRGGEVIETFARRENNNIRSTLRVASTVSPRGAQPDIPLAVILPEYDGDVCQMEGQIVFDDVFTAAQNQSFANIVYLRGANHNFFHRRFERDDRYGARSLANPEDQSNWLSREEHERFLKRYAAAFLAVVTGQREPWGAFSALEPQPATMFGFAVTASSYTPGMQPLIAAPTQEHLAVNTSGSADVNFYLQSYPLATIGHGLFNHPTAMNRQGGLPLYHLTWDDRDGAAEFPLLMEDLSEGDAISLFVAMDSSDERNARYDEQSFTVVLTDSHGAQQSVLIPYGTSALLVHPGELEDAYEWGPFWIGWTPLGELRIPLGYFDEVDLSAVTQLTIRFDQTNVGAVMLAGGYLV